MKSKRNFQTKRIYTLYIEIIKKRMTAIELNNNEGEKVMEAYKKEFIEFMVECDVLKFG